MNYCKINQSIEGSFKMINLNKKYKLKEQYKLGSDENCNYILSHTGVKCVFLNPLPAFILNNILQSNNLAATVETLSAALTISEDEAKVKIFNIIEKLSDYLEENPSIESDSVFDIEKSKEILKRNKEFICPVTKAEHPRKIKFYLTDYCPRACIYCFAGAKYIGKEKQQCNSFLSVDRFKEIILEAKEIGVNNIEISGGDPFVLPEIYEYLDVMIKYFPYEWGTSTKAHLTKFETDRLATIGLPEIQVSIDSFIPEHADKLMGVKGAFEEILETIKNLQESGIVVTTKTTITSINILDIPQLFMKLIAMGIKHLRFSYYYISANRHGDYLYPTNHQIEWLNKNMKEPLAYAKEKGVITDFYNHEPYATSRGANNRLICGGFTETLCVKPDGGVLFCDSLNHSDDFIAGNLKTQGIIELWNSDGVKNMNDPFFFKEKYKGTKCYDYHLFGNCFYKRCYVRTFAKYGRYFDIDPACPFGDPEYIIK